MPTKDKTIKTKEERITFKELLDVVLPIQVVRLCEGQDLEVIGEDTHVDSGKPLTSSVLYVHVNQDDNVESHQDANHRNDE